MKILHVLDHSLPLHSGYTFRTLAILAAQAAMGWQTCQVTSGKQGVTKAASEEYEGLRFYRSRPTPAPLSRLPLAPHWQLVQTLQRRIGEVIALEQPDLLHAHSPALVGLAALLAGRRARLPVLYECRAFWEDAASDHGTAPSDGVRYRLSRALETLVFRQADAVTCICEGLRQDIIARGVPAAKVTVIPNAVDGGRFRQVGERDPELVAQLGLGGHAVIGFIGSFYAYEGLDLAIAALPRILQQRSVRLLLVGGGPQEPALRDQVRQLGLTEQVCFTGRVPHSEVSRYYSLPDIMLYPRHRMRLTDLVTPLKPLEAMAQGKLVVASDVGGHRELIRDGDTGCLFAADDPAALAETLLGILAAPQRAAAITRAARQFVERERNWQHSVARYQSVYERLISIQRAPVPT